MKYIITEEQNDRLMSGMEKFMKKTIGDVPPKLEMIRHKGKGNSGWGSSMHDYTYYNDDYITEDGTILFKSYDDRYMHTDYRWDVSDKFESMYNFFGEERFENFIEWYFGFDIKNKGERKENWVFDKM